MLTPLWLWPDLPLQTLFLNFQEIPPTCLWALQEAEADFQSLSAAQQINGNCGLEDIALGACILPSATLPWPASVIAGGRGGNSPVPQLLVVLIPVPLGQRTAVLPKACPDGCQPCWKRQSWQRWGSLLRVWRSRFSSSSKAS